MSPNLWEFLKLTRHAVFYFLFFLFSLQSAFASTHIQNQKLLKNVYFRIFRNQTGFYTFFELPCVFKFFQNSKISSFFIVKMKKKTFKKKKCKPEFCKIKCAWKNKCARKLWDTEFFFSLILWSLWFPWLKYVILTNVWNMKLIFFYFFSSHWPGTIQYGVSKTIH